MKSLKIIRLSALVLALAGVTVVSRAAATPESHDVANKAAAGQLVPVTEKDAAWLTKAKAEYPTNMCVVSDDKLGSDMGKPADFIYREEGKPDRLVSFCCKDCVKDFNGDPQKYLKMLDAAAAAKKS